MYKKGGQFRARSGGNFDIFLSFFRWLTWQKWDGEGERGLLRSITRNNFATVFKPGKRRLRLIISNSIMQITRLARANDTREVRAMSQYSISACSYFAFLVTYIPSLDIFRKLCAPEMKMIPPLSLSYIFHRTEARHLCNKRSTILH